MPSLQVREMPPDIYHKLQKNAEAKHRSLAQEALVTLARGLETSTSNIYRRRALLATINDNKPLMPENPEFTPTLLIREDRER